MKKIGIGILASCLLTFSLTACSSSSIRSEAPVGTKTSETDAGTSGGDKTTGTKENEPSSGSKKTIVFSTFWPDAGFLETKKKYEALHPNIEIKLQFGFNHDIDDTADQSKYEAMYNADMEKYLTTMNTTMLAGKGPDLLEMRYLPTESYVKQKQLADLGKMMDQDSAFRKEDYFSNILDSVRASRGLYSMPLSFNLVGLLGEEEAIAKTGVIIDDKVWSWNDFMNSAKQIVAAKGKYKYALSGSTAGLAGIPPGPEELLGDMVQDNYSLYVDGVNHKAKFDSVTFTSLIKQVKAMYDDKIVTPMGQAYFTNIRVISPEDYLTSLQTYTNSKVYMKPHAVDAGEGGYFTTSVNVGVNANSKVKQEAWDFLKYMMTEETGGLPISKKGFAAVVQQLKDKGTITPHVLGPLNGKTFNVDAVKLEQLESLAKGASHPVEYNVKVREIILKESKAFFAGQKSADDVAKLIQNKVTTYLNE